MPRYIPFLVLLLPLACESPDSDQTKGNPQDIALARKVEMVLKTEDTRAAQKAYNELFSTVGIDGIYSLKFHPNDNIALHAAWEEARRAIRSSQNTQEAAKNTDKALQRLVGFLEGRLRAPLPNWWENGLRHVETSEEGNVYPGVAEALFNYHKTDAGFRAPPNTLIANGKEGLVLRIGSQSFSIPRKLVDSQKELGKGESISACVDDDNWYLTFHSSVPTSHNLFCIEKKSGKILWNSPVEGRGGGGYEGGGWFHHVQIVAKGNRVLVFGGSVGFLYVQGFNKHDGKSLFRFWTRKVPRATDTGADVPN
jgi:hypothetical protein